MKISSINIINDGMAQADAEKFWDDVLGFAAYSFNKSHSVAYSLIGYQAAYLKAHYPVEFYTASMGIASDDKLAPLVKQAAKDGIRVIPPDINVSTNRFEPLNDFIIAAPFNAIKGVSERGALAIIEARKTPTTITETSGRGKNKVTTTRTLGPGRFLSMEDFRNRVPARAVNSAALEKLDKVGAFARVEPDQFPSTHDSRQRDQIELMPAISDQGVAANRKIVVCEQAWEQLTDNHEGVMDIFGDSAPDIKVGDDSKLMIILDHPFDDYQHPTNQWSYTNYVAPALYDAGLCFNDLIWTYVARRPKRKGEREIPGAEMRAGVPFLKREIEILKPPVIVLLGPNAIRTFFPDIKGLAEHVGRKTYIADLDATVIIGFNPTQLYHDPTKKDALTKVFQEAKKLVDSN